MEKIYGDDADDEEHENDITYEEITEEAIDVTDSNIE